MAILLMVHSLYLKLAAISGGSRGQLQRKILQPSCTGIGQERNTASPNSLHPGITLGPGTRARPEIHKEADKPRIPLERCLGTATLAAPCPFCQAHSNLIAQANRLTTAGAAPQIFPCERIQNSLRIALWLNSTGCQSLYLHLTFASCCFS
jgi:hypothetical protein